MAGRRATDKLRAEWFWADRWTTSRGHSLPVGPRGVYREMLTQAWLREAKLPNDPEEICRICAFTKKEWKACWPAVEPFWVVDGSFLVNVTQVVIYLEAKEAAEKSTTRAQAGAQAMHERRRSKAVSSAHALPSVSVSDSEPLSGQNPERDARAPARTNGNGGHTTSGAMAGMLPRDHLRHKVCGRVCLHETQFEQFVRKLGGVESAATQRIGTWARETLNAWEVPPLMDTPIQGNGFQWWDARWLEWQGTPKAVQKRPDGVTGGSVCGHTPMCRTVSDCIAKTIADGRAQKAASA